MVCKFRLLLPQSLQQADREAQPQRAPRDAPPEALWAGRGFAGYIESSAAEQKLFFMISKTCMSSKELPSSLRLVMLAFGETVMLDITVDNPFEGLWGEEPLDMSVTAGSQPADAQHHPAEREYFTMVIVKLPPTAEILAAYPPGVPVVILLYANDEEQIEKVQDSGCCMVSSKEVCDELTVIWHALTTAIRVKEERQEVDVQGLTSPNALRALDKAFGGDKRDKGSWATCWKEFLEPLVYDLASTLYSAHYSVYLQQKLRERLYTAAVRPVPPSPAPPPVPGAKVPANLAVWGMSHILRPQPRGSSKQPAVAEAVAQPPGSHVEQHNHIAEASNTHAFSSDNKPPPALAAAAPLVTETEPKEEDPLFLASLLKKSAEEVPVQSPGPPLPRASPYGMQENDVDDVVLYRAAPFNPTGLVAEIFDLVQDVQPVNERLLSYLIKQPYKLPALQCLVNTCADTSKQALLWTNDRISSLRRLPPEPTSVCPQALFGLARTAMQGWQEAPVSAKDAYVAYYAAEQKRRRQWLLTISMVQTAMSAAWCYSVAKHSLSFIPLFMMISALFLITLLKATRTRTALLLQSAWWGTALFSAKSEGDTAAASLAACLLLLQSVIDPLTCKEPPVNQMSLHLSAALPAVGLLRAQMSPTHVAFWGISYVALSMLSAMMWDGFHRSKFTRAALRGRVDLPSG